MKLRRLSRLAAIAAVLAGGVLSVIGSGLKNPQGTGGSGSTGFAYVANKNAGTVSAFERNGDGTLDAIGTASPSAGQVQSLAVDANSDFLFAVGPGTDQLFAYSIASTGALSALTSATLATGANPVAVAASPLARLVYVANGDSTLAVYSYSSAGAFSQVGTPVTLAAVPRAIAIDPTGSFLYVAASTDILEFDIGATGALTANPASSPAAGSAPDALAFDPSGDHLLATNYAASTLTLFSVDGSNHGALTTTGSSKSVGSTPTGIAVDAAGTHVYVSNGGGAGASQVYAFTLTGNVLGDVSGSPFSVAPGVGPQTVALDGGFAYTPNLSSDDVSRMTVNGGTGVLGTASTTPAGDGPADMVFANP